MHMVLLHSAETWFHQLSLEHLGWDFICSAGVAGWDKTYLGQCSGRLLWFGCRQIRNPCWLVLCQHSICNEYKFILDATIKKLLENTYFYLTKKIGAIVTTAIKMEMQCTLQINDSRKKDENGTLRSYL